METNRHFLRCAVGAAVASLALVSFAPADVFNLGPGLTSLETVPVGNPGNAADSTGYGAVAYGYNIGKYPVTAGQYTVFLNAVAAADPYGLYNTSMWTSAFGCKIERGGTPGNYSYSVAADWANRPVNFVSWGDAARFANWLHNGQPTGAQGPATTETGAYTLNGAMTIAELMAISRNADWQWAITSEDEWYKAAYHKNDGATGNYWLYPTSSNIAPGRDLNDISGNNANYYGTPFPIDSPHYTTVVGQFHNSASPYGTFDQGGNVLQWNETLAGSFRGLRGGSFFYNEVEMLASNPRYGDPTFEFFDIGFRVSEVPEPASLVLLALGAVGMIHRRRNVRG